MRDGGSGWLGPGDHSGTVFECRARVTRANLQSNTEKRAMVCLTASCSAARRGRAAAEEALGGKRERSSRRSRLHCPASCSSVRLGLLSSVSRRGSSSRLLAPQPRGHPPLRASFLTRSAAGPDLAARQLLRHQARAHAQAVAGPQQQPPKQGGRHPRPAPGDRHQDALPPRRPHRPLRLRLPGGAADRGGRGGPHHRRAPPTRPPRAAQTHPAPPPAPLTPLPQAAPPARAT